MQRVPLVDGIVDESPWSGASRGSGIDTDGDLPNVLVLISSLAGRVEVCGEDVAQVY